MPTNEKKGITVKIDAELHAEVKQYLEQHGMTMADFVTMALQDELHPKFEQKEEQSMEKMRFRCRRICFSGSRTICTATI